MRFVGLLLSLLAFVIQAWRPYRAELGRVTGLRGYHDLSRNDEAERIPGVVILRFDAPLFFANGGLFEDFVRSRVEAAGPGVHTVILAAEPITDVDTTAGAMLEDLDVALNKGGISLVFAELKDPVRNKVNRYELTRVIDPAHFFPTLDAAVTAFQQETGTRWSRIEHG